MLTITEISLAQRYRSASTPDAPRHDEQEAASDPERTETAPPGQVQSESPAAQSTERSQQPPNHGVNLVYKEEASVYVVEVRDKESGEIVRQFPPKELVLLRQRTQELLGKLVDRKS
jgi:uncharacterized FlaG/YvyC family protein